MTLKFGSTERVFFLGNLQGDKTDKIMDGLFNCHIVGWRKISPNQFEGKPYQTEGQAQITEAQMLL